MTDAYSVLRDARTLALGNGWFARCSERFHFTQSELRDATILMTMDLRALHFLTGAPRASCTQDARGHTEQ